MTEGATKTANTAIIAGALFIVLGIAAYFISDFASLTALIPAFIGVPLLILGYLGRQDGTSAYVAYGIALLGVIVILGAVPAFGDISTFLAEGEFETPIATISQLVMLVLGCVIVGVFAAEQRRP